ncbi:transferase, chloramphenicol acetyltransferase-like domain protein [Tanacetum coccineum]
MYSGEADVSKDMSGLGYEGATSGGVKLNPTITRIESHLLSPRCPRKFASASLFLKQLSIAFKDRRMKKSHKATRRLLKLQQYHVNHDQHFLPRLYHVPNPLGLSKSMELPSLFSCEKYSTSSILNATEFSEGSMNCNKHESNIKKVDLEIITRSIVKPASPTPHHLKHLKLSILDQILLDTYTPLILFIPNSDKASVNDVITKRSKHLKESLSHILTQFYPIAGEVKDNLQIECNDKGVYYIEARVNQTLEDFKQSRR